jgi:hypothetical protein
VVRGSQIVGTGVDPRASKDLDFHPPSMTALMAAVRLASGQGFAEALVDVSQA